jgi:hypothetical protein
MTGSLPVCSTVSSPTCHQETKRLRVELTDWDGQEYHAVYDHFKVLLA